jgi:hypothetical protein
MGGFTTVMPNISKFSWAYRKSHVINSADGAGKNYQVKITVHYGSGTDSGADVYLNGKCKSDFSDIIFTASDGCTFLDYWMDFYTAGDNAVFWVKIPDDLSVSSATIYMYYGNPNFSSRGNGDNTFLFFDDFSGSSLNTTKWSVVLNSPVVDGGYLKLTYDRVQSVTTFGTGYAVLIRSKVVTDASDNVWGFRSGSYYIIFRTYLSGYTYTYNTAAEQYAWAQDNAENTYQIIRNGSTNVIFQKNYVNVNTHTTQVPTASMPIYLANDASDEFWVNWVAVRKYVSPEPTHGSWGSEELL